MLTSVVFVITSVDFRSRILINGFVSALLIIDRFSDVIYTCRCWLCVLITDPCCHKVVLIIGDARVLINVNLLAVGVVSARVV